MRELALTFLKLSLLGFGGPSSHIALMHAELVERRRWLDEPHFLHLLAVTNLLPGPNSSEVAMHIGYVRRGRLGGIVAGTCFVLPTLLLITACAVAYFRFGARLKLDTLLFGIKPAVIALILVAGARLAKSTVTDAATCALGLLGAGVVVFAPRAEILAMAVGLLVGIATPARGAPAPPKDQEPAMPALPAWMPMAPVTLLAATSSIAPLPTLLWLCFRTGALLFGGGYLVVPLLYPEVVTRHGWVSPQQFLDGIAISHSLPGPITTVVAFIAYPVGGVVGAFLAVTAIYIPSFVAVLLVAPWLERARRERQVAAALRGVNAVVAGSIVGTALVLTRPAIQGKMAAGIGLLALLAFALRPKWNTFWVIATAAGFGMAVRALGL